MDKVEGYLTSCSRATGRRGTSGRRRSHWLATWWRSTPTLPTLTVSSFWAPSARRRAATGTAPAVYQSLLTDYPGSPLVAEARKKLDAADQEAGSRGWKVLIGRTFDEYPLSQIRAADRMLRDLPSPPALWLGPVTLSSILERPWNFPWWGPFSAGMRMVRPDSRRFQGQDCRTTRGRPSRPAG